MVEFVQRLAISCVSRTRGGFSMRCFRRTGALTNITTVQESKIFKPEIQDNPQPKSSCCGHIFKQLI